MHDIINAAHFTMQIDMFGQACLSHLFKIQQYLNLGTCENAIQGNLTVHVDDLNKTNFI